MRFRGASLKMRWRSTMPPPSLPGDYISLMCPQTHRKMKHFITELWIFTSQRGFTFILNKIWFEHMKCKPPYSIHIKKYICIRVCTDTHTHIYACKDIYVHTHTREQWLNREKQFPNCWSRGDWHMGAHYHPICLTFQYIWNFHHQRGFVFVFF